MVDQITAEELAERLDAGEAFTLVDTRPSESFKGWHIHGAQNVPYHPHDGLDDEFEQVEEFAGDGPVVTVCGRGLTSTSFGFTLEEHGFEDVTVVKGGMEDWSKVYEVVPVETTGDLVVVQVQRRAKGCLGYVVGSRVSGEAVAVDVTRQTDVFKVVAEEAGLTLTHVLDTHVHADHISGGPALARELDVPYVLSEHAADRGVRHEFEPLADDEPLSIGGVELRALHTPGHTSEMTSILVDDEFLLTGDALFVDSVGRTELQFGDADVVDGARLLHESLHDTVLELPDDVMVLPGHVSVTTDGQYETGSPGELAGAQLGDLRTSLDLLGLDEDAFVSRLTENAPEKPPNYETVIGVNTGERDVADEAEATELELGPNNCAA